MNLYQMTTSELLERIEQLQGVQKRNPSTSVEWRAASELLAPCFAEMARREGGTNHTVIRGDGRAVRVFVPGGES